MALLTQAASTWMCQRLVAARLTGAISYRQISGARLIPRFSVFAVTESLPKGRLSESSAEAGATLRSHRHTDACTSTRAGTCLVLPHWPLRAIFKCIHVEQFIWNRGAHPLLRQRIPPRGLRVGMCYQVHVPLYAVLRLAQGDYSQQIACRGPGLSRYDTNECRWRWASQ